MKNLTTIVLPALALGAATLLLAPAPQVYGFSKIGGSLQAGTQRDWRVFNNFADATAVDNTTGSTQFPGWLGAELALWKAAAEWGSRPHGDGSGDPHQVTVGDGGGNFDFTFCGSATGPGGSNRNIVSTIPNCGGGTFAYVLSPISNGWTMKFCEEWVWSDDTTAPIAGRIDIQGVATHEFGHCTGLGHSADNSATMVGGTANGYPKRSIEADDIAGLHCIYGAASVSKPIITGVSVDLVMDEITITGSNFTPTDNAVWFTRDDPTAAGAEPRLITAGLNSTGGGTQIVVGIPAEAASGDLLVKLVGTGHDSLSNAFPYDIGVFGGVEPLAVTGISPSSVPALIPGSTQTVTVTGTGFTDDTELLMDAFFPVAAEDFTVVSNTTITMNMPQVTNAGIHTLLVQDGAQFDTIGIDVTQPTTPVLECGNGDPLNTVSGTVRVRGSGPIGDVQYVLYSESNLPSAIPIVSLDIGNFFTDLHLATQYAIATSYVEVNLPLPALTLDFYLQSLTLSMGTPIPVSNLQSIHVIP